MIAQDQPPLSRSVTALVGRYRCFVVAAGIVLEMGALFPLFVGACCCSSLLFVVSRLYEILPTYSSYSDSQLIASKQNEKHSQSESKSSMAMEALLVSPIPVLMGVLSTSSNSSVPSILGRPWSSRMVTCTV